MNELKKVEENNMISVIERMASNPDVDVDKLERIMAMQERMIDKSAEQDWSIAMVNTQQSMPLIPVTGKNPQTNSGFAKLEVINRLITPVYTENGFSVSFSQEKSEFEDCIKIVGVVSHSGGHSKRYEYDSPIDDKGIKGTVNKTPTHGRASAVSYGQRYLIKLIFNLILEGEDDDGNLGDGRTAIDIQNYWIDQTGKWRELFDTINAIKQAIAINDMEALCEAWCELSNDEKNSIYNPAPTKGGILTVKERGIFKTEEYQTVRNELYPPQE